MPMKILLNKINSKIYKTLGESCLYEHNKAINSKISDTIYQNKNEKI